jgi:hypothetical protein
MEKRRRSATTRHVSRPGATKALPQGGFPHDSIGKTRARPLRFDHPDFRGFSRGFARDGRSRFA